MSDTVNILNFFHEPSMASWPPKSQHYQNEETRNRISKFLPEWVSYQNFWHESFNIL